LIDKFTLENVGKSAGVFNPEKFLWVNFQYLKTKPLSQLAKDIIPFIEAKGYPVPQEKAWLEKMIATLRERAKTLAELVDAAHYYLTEDVTFDDKTAKKFLTKESVAPMESLIQKLSALSDFTEAAIEKAFTQTLEEHGLQMGALAQPVRVGLTGGTVSPGIHDVISVLGKERTIRRLRKALDYVDQT
jgi:glutamyl-tRNA synthetase